MITGKTVYVFGAGASQHTGAPLLRDFLLVARILRESQAKLTCRASFDRLFKWVDSLRGSSYYVEFDLDNLEHVFSLAEMQRQLGLEAESDVSGDLRRVIMETLDHKCQLRWLERKFQPEAIYSEFVGTLTNLDNSRKLKVNQTSGGFEKDVIVTFNYDVMLDYAMQFKGVGPEYCLGSSPDEGKFHLLKLHGSSNWSSCRKCKDKPPHALRISPLREGEIPNPKIRNGEHSPLRIATHVLTGTPCPYCQDLNNLEPLIIPPTWSKNVSNSPIASIWAQAVAELKTAFQIIIIGYSLPSTDTFFQYLLTLALNTNPRLHRVIVVNRDGSEDFKARYRGVFSRSLADRGRLWFVTGTTFQDFVKNEMTWCGSRLDRRE